MGPGRFADGAEKCASPAKAGVHGSFATAPAETGSKTVDPRLRGGNRKRLGAWAAVALPLLLATLLTLDRLFPPDLSRYRDRGTLVLDQDGGTLRAFLAADGTWRLHADPGQVSGTYLALLKAYEDKRFDRHPGVDPLALARAVGQALWHGEVVSGGSTLTMQVARLLEPRPRTLGAKLAEMARALQLEARYGKEEILAMYLTLAPFGGNLEGVRAAALAYWGREPDRLTLSQAALLVALPQSPTARRPDERPEAAKAARDRVLARLSAAGVLDPRDAAEAAEEPVPTARLPLPQWAPHLAERLRRSHPAGSTIASTIDPVLQSQAESIAAEARRRLEPEAEVALLVVETATRQVRAYVGGSFDGPGGQVDMVRAVRSPGSALKPLLYALAFEDLPLHPETRIDDRPVAFGAYRPRNFDGGFRGSVTVREALQASLNVPAVALLSRLGPTRAAGRLSAAGARLVLPEGAGGRVGLPLALGGVGIRLEDMALLYAALADGGTARPLRFTEGQGAGDPRRLVGPVAAWQVADILAGTPRPDGRSAGDGARPFAYKTGTSYGYRDAWAVGFSPAHVAVVWVGRPDGTPRPGAMGRGEAAPILFRLADLLPDAGPFPPAPPGTVLAGPGTPLPAPLRQFELLPPTVMAVSRPGPRVAPLGVAFPPDGAEVDLGVEAGAPLPLPLEAMGGQPPFRWLVNGLPVQGAGWLPDGPGFAEVAVTDASGQRAAVQVRVR